MRDIDRVKEVFLSYDIDEETRAENEQRIREWEIALTSNKAFADWQSHDITIQIVKQAKETYRDISIQLATSRSLTDEQRHSLWGKQDACLFLLSLIEKDARGALEQIHREIRAALE